MEYGYPICFPCFHSSIQGLNPNVYIILNVIISLLHICKSHYDYNKESLYTQCLQKFWIMMILWYNDCVICWSCQHEANIDVKNVLYHSTNRSLELFPKSYKWMNQFAAFAIEAWWLSEYSLCITNDVDIIFQNGCLCWQNAVLVNAFNSLNS